MVIRHHARYVTAPVCLAAVWAVAGLGQRHSLTPADIAQAIEWGQSGRPEAYPLRSAFPRNKTTSGVVYTPYLRVALAARAAREEERGFTAEDVTSEMTAPFIYFAIGEVGEDPLPPGPLPADTPVSMRLITDHSRPDSSDRREISPAWVRRDVPAFLRYGLRPNWSYMFAAFRIEQVKADTRVELYRKFREGSRGQLLATPGLVTEADLSAWR